MQLLKDTQYKWMLTLEKILKKLESYIWGNEHSVDTETPVFYVYCSYPTSLKSADIEDWVNIQVKTHCPFEHSDHYVFHSRSGVAIWQSRTPFKGIPETAMQVALPDGDHYVQSEHYVYQQKWRNGTMISCHIVDEYDGETRRMDTLLLDSPWAKSNKLKTFIQTPAFGALAIGGVFAVFMVWQSVGYITHVVQQGYYNAEVERLQLELGENLAVKERFQNNIQVLNGLKGWQDTGAYLPQLLSLVIDVVLETNQWDARTIEWQNGKLLVELSAQDLDITELVEKIESMEEFKQVSIRPNNKPGSWDLEVVANVL